MDVVKYAGIELRNQAVAVLLNEAEKKGWQGNEIALIKNRIKMIRGMTPKTYPVFAMAMRMRHGERHNI